MGVGAGAHTLALSGLRSRTPAHMTDARTRYGR